MIESIKNEKVLHSEDVTEEEARSFSKILQKLEVHSPRKTS